jgi:hypothetical protein
MNYGHLSLRQLVCVSPTKKPAALDFTDGANAIIGFSNTGKSFILELIDYMLGGEKLERLAQIPELEGYDTALLTLHHSDGSTFTLRRALNDGDINVLEGVVDDRTGGKVLETIVRRDRKSGQPRSFSQFFLDKLGISEKVIRRSESDTGNLTFRPLIRLSIVDEERIISKVSPALSGQHVSATPEKSIFKFLLTGTDDSALVLYSEQSKAAQQKTEQANVAQKLLSQRRQQLEADGLNEEALRSELAKIEAQLAGAQSESQDAEGTVATLRRRLRRLAELKDLAHSRVNELDALLERFKLLDQHYESDIDRLTAIAEASKNLEAIAPGPCPLCGAPPEAHQSTAGCAGDLEALSQAATAETKRIIGLRGDLQPTVAKAIAEKQELLRRNDEADTQASEVNVDLVPALEAARAQRAGYSQVLQQWAAVKENLRAFDAVKDFEESAAVLKREAEEMAPSMPDIAISRASTDGFAQEVAAILKAWNVPQTDRVAFDHQANDLQLNSRLRGGQGKGLRALTHAAFSVALMTYCLKNDRPHPGFVVLDSPLLSYRGEENEPDPTQDLKSTTVDQAFYRWLANDLKHGQVIVIENRDPPQDVRARIHLHEFLPNADRKGFIPA